jgi:hypothetical protein
MRDSKSKILHKCCSHIPFAHERSYRKQVLDGKLLGNTSESVLFGKTTTTSPQVQMSPLHELQPKMTGIC